MSKKSDAIVQQDVAALKKLCEQDRRDAVDDANYWRGIPAGGLESIPIGRDFIRRRVEQAETHAAGREIDISNLVCGEKMLCIVQEVATEERSANAKNSDNKGGRPTLIEEARVIASHQKKKMKKNSKSVRAKDIQRELEKTIPTEDVPGEDTIRQWDIFND